MRLKDISKAELERIVAESTSIAQVLDTLGYSKCSTAYTAFHKTCEVLGIKYSHFSLGLSANRGKSSTTKLTLNDLLGRLTVGGKGAPKRQLIEHGLLVAKCYGDGCTITDMWLGKSITLQVDHINGINSDNRIENLRLLCPNCHSQTSTFSGRNSKKPQTLCADCKSPVTRNSTRCSPCSGKRVNSKRRKVIVSKDRLATLLTNHTYTDIGTMFGVSDTAIRKLAKKYDIGKSVKMVHHTCLLNKRP